MNALADSPVAIIAICAVLLAIVILGRRVSFSVGNVHAELKSNGGRSIKDRMDRVDRNIYIIASHLGIAADMEIPPEKIVVVNTTVPASTGGAATATEVAVQGQLTIE